MGPDPEIERRAHPRFTLLAQVRVKRGKVDYVMELSNISRSGALFSIGSLQPRGWIEPHRVLEVSIIHPDTLDAIEVKGEVVRVEKTDRDTVLALRFIEVSAELEAQIDRWITDSRETARRPKMGPPPLPT